MSNNTQNITPQPNVLGHLLRNLVSGNATIASIIVKRAMSQSGTVTILIMIAEDTSITTGTLANIGAESVPKTVVAALKMRKRGANTSIPSVRRHTMTGEPDTFNKIRRNTYPGVLNIEPNTQN